MEDNINNYENEDVYDEDEDEFTQFQIPLAEWEINDLFEFRDKQNKMAESDRDPVWCVIDNIVELIFDQLENK